MYYKDFDLIIRHFPANDDLRIYPISDVHLGAAEHMDKAWGEFLQMLQSDPNAYVVLVGDLLNNCTRSSISNIFEETLRPREQKRIMADMLLPIRDKILCCVSGNHERRSLKDADDEPCYDIMCKLDIEDRYRQNMAFIKIQCGNIAGEGGKNPTYIMAVTHGAGGGIFTGATINRLERYGYVVDGADILVAGHSHKPFVSQPAKIKVDPYNNKVSLKPFKVVSATSWLEYGGYAAQKMLLPSSHALQVIELAGNKKEIKVRM